MRLFPLAYAAGLLPLFTIHLCYFLAASAGQLPWCNPYIDSCTSISATGREPPAYFVFKGLMIPAALLLMTYWLLTVYWLRQLGCVRYGWQTLVLVLGMLAGLGLIFYSVLLGAIPVEYRQPRHAGVVTFFACSFFAQWVATWRLGAIGVIKTLRGKRLAVLKGLLVLLLLGGLGHLLLGYVSPVMYDASTNAVAWCFTLLLCVHVLVSAELWRRTGWRLGFAIDDGVEGCEKIG